MACFSVGASAARRSTASRMYRYAVAIPTRKPAVGVAAAQVGQDEQGLPATGQAAQPGADPVAVTCEETGEVLQGTTGQINTGRVEKHAEAPGGLVILVENPPTRGFSCPSAHLRSALGGVGNAHAVAHWSSCRTPTRSPS